MSREPPAKARAAGGSVTSGSAPADSLRRERLAEAGETTAVMVKALGVMQSQVVKDPYRYSKSHGPRAYAPDSRALPDGSLSPIPALRACATTCRARMNGKTESRNIAGPASTAKPGLAPATQKARPGRGHVAGPRCLSRDNALVNSPQPPRAPFDSVRYVQRSREGPCFVCAILAGHPDYPHYDGYEDAATIAFLARQPTLLARRRPQAPRRRRGRRAGTRRSSALQRVVRRVAGPVAKVVPVERMYC